MTEEEKNGSSNQAEQMRTEPSTKEESLMDSEQAKDKKIKNLISALILVAGLFVGSLFVDVIQIFRGGGFSQRALDNTDVFASNGKTWVAYTEPIVTVQVVSDDTCGDACKPDEVLVGLKQALPTLLTRKIDANSDQGKKLISEFGIKTLPAFIFSNDIEKTNLFTNAQPFLDKQGDFYAIKSGEAGFPIGKYIVQPPIDKNDIKIGSDDAKVKVVEFSDFSNPVDAQFYKDVIAPMANDYSGKIQIVFKNYFAPTSTQALSAALASECANEQGKFLPYADKLYATQAVWSKLKDATATLEAYAAGLGLNTTNFNQCLTSKKYQDQNTQSASEGQSFGVSETPSIFIGTNLQTSAAKYDDIKKIIDDQLAK